MGKVKILEEGKTPPRFLLVLAVHENLLRAALVTRDLRMASSAHQSFEIRGDELDPAEVWYKTKKIFAACLDIGRTQTREIAGIALVTSETEMVTWRENGNEIIAQGERLPSTKAGARNESQFVETNQCTGTLGTWLVWNLTGVYVTAGVSALGKTRARAPFDAELPVVALLDETRAREFTRTFDFPEADRVLLGAARFAWETLGAREFAKPPDS